MIVNRMKTILLLIGDLQSCSRYYHNIIVVTNMIKKCEWWRTKSSTCVLLFWCARTGTKTRLYPTSESETSVGGSHVTRRLFEDNVFTRRFTITEELPGSEMKKQGSLANNDGDNNEMFTKQDSCAKWIVVHFWNVICKTSKWNDQSVFWRT